MAIEVTALNKKEIVTKGWTICSMGLNVHEIRNYLTALKNLEQKASDSKYSLRRQYFPHIFHENVAAIESPFNKLISNNCIEEFFAKISLGNAIQELLGWQECHLHLARLFTMDHYKYRGNWHRDFNDWDGDLVSLKSIQVALYLKDQDGFRIFKYNHDSLLRANNKAFKDPDPLPALPLTCSSEYFEEIKGVAGTALFFSPGMIHQGNSFTKRLDYHLRFSCDPLIVGGKPQNESVMFDFIAPEFYLKDFEIKHDKYCAKTREISFREKIANSINYYTGIINFAKLIKSINTGTPKPPWSYTYGANTIFQRKTK